MKENSCFLLYTHYSCGTIISVGCDFAKLYTQHFIDYFVQTMQSSNLAEKKMKKKTIHCGKELIYGTIKHDGELNLAGLRNEQIQKDIFLPEDGRKNDFLIRAFN